MPDDTYKALMDVSNFIQGAQRIDLALKDLKDGLKEVTNVTVDFNAKGNATAATLKGISVAGDQVSQSIAKVGASFKLTSSSIDLTASNLEKAKSAIKGFTDKLNQDVSSTVLAKVATQAEKLDFKNALVKLEEFVAKNKVSVQQVETVYNNLQSGIVGKYSSALQQVQSLLVGVTNAERQLGAAAQAAGKQELAAIQEVQSARRAAAAGSQVGNSILSSIDPAKLVAQKGGSSTGEVFNVNRAIGQLQTFVQANRISAGLVTQMWQQVQTGAFQPLAGTLGQLQGRLQAVNAAIGGLGAATNAANATSKGFLLSWQSITRFFEARVLYNSISQITNAVQRGVESSIEFGEKVAQIRTLTPVGTFNDWDAAIKRVSNSLGTDALDTAKGFYNALSNQIGDNVSEIEAFTKTTAQFARTTASSAEEANNLFSAAINSFKLNTSDANTIAAKFFKTIDLGRVTAQGLSGNFGRVAAAAGAIGVSLDETLAALALLSKQGVSDSDAMTQLLNIFNKLLKPTDAMKEALKEWGFSSGEALINAEGFTGALKRLNNELETKGSSALAKELGDLRALRGGLSLTGKGFADYQDILQQVTNSQESYNRAVGITQETTSFKLKAQLEQVKNTFLSLGQTIAEVAVKATAPFGGLAGALKDLTALLITGATAAFAVWAGRAVLAIGSVTNAMKVLRAAVASANPLAFIGIVAGAVASFLLLSENAQERAQRVYGETLDSLENQNKGILANLDRIAKNATANLNSVFQPLLRNIAAARGELNKTFNQLTEITQSFNKRIKDIAEADFRSIDDVLGQIRDKISELKSIENKALSDLKKDTQKASIVSFEDSIEELPVFKRVKAIQQHIDDLTRTAQSEAKAGQFADAQGTLEEIRSLQTRLISEAKAGAKEQHALEKQNLDLKQQQNDAKREDIGLTKEINDINNQRALKAKVVGTGRNKKLVGPNQDQLDLTDDRALLQSNKRDELTARLDASDKQLIENQRKLNELRSDSRGVDIEKSIVAEREKLAAIDQQIADAAHAERVRKEQELRDEEDKKEILKIQYDTLKQVTALGKDNPLFNSDQIKTASQAIAEFDKIFNRVAEARKAAGITTNLGDVIGLAELEKVTKARAQAFFAGKEAEDLSSKLEAQQKSLQGIIDASRQTAENALRLRTEAASKLGSVSDAISPLNFGGEGSQEEDAVNALIIKMKELAQAVSLTPENIKTALPAFQALDRQLEQAVNVPGLENNKSLQDLNVKLQESLLLFETIRQNNQKQILATGAIDEATRAVNQIKAATTDYGTVGTDVLQGQISQVKDLIDQYNNLGATIRSAQSAGQEAVGGVPADVIHKAGGGFIPRGTDTIPALLSPGEFVLNAKTARSFYSQLTALNSPSGYSKGGAVTTNVGDITVNVQSSSNTNVDATRIGRAIRTQIKRGALSLK